MTTNKTLHVVQKFTKSGVPYYILTLDFTGGNYFRHITFKIITKKYRLAGRCRNMISDFINSLTPLCTTTLREEDGPTIL